jgi:hypothetical protein
MKRAKLILAAVVFVMSLASYGASCKKKDRCPEMGESSPKTEIVK